MKLWTDRLILREYVAEDFEDMFAYESDPLVVQYVCYGPYSREECWQQLSYHIEHQTAVPRIYFHLGIVQREEERLIGWCGLEVISRENQEAELGYALHRNYWGHGYMTEAAQVVIEAGFEQLNLHRIFATCSPANTGTVRVLEKVGMRYEGCLMEQKWCRGEWRDTAVYALLAHEIGK